jgi:hypothetical protein
MVRPCVQKKSKITIRVLGEDEIRDAADLLDLKKYKAWCTYDGLDDEGNKKFTVVLNFKRINNLGKKPITRLKQLLIDLGHELTHVKQYLNNELFDYKSGDVRYKGLVFDASHYMDEEKYFDSPWEIEAYGRELGLYKIFCNKLKEEREKQYNRNSEGLKQRRLKDESRWKFNPNADYSSEDDDVIDEEEDWGYDPEWEDQR